MKFEEEFPSLKGLSLSVEDIPIQYDNCPDIFYNKEVIKRLCFDKQRVRKILIEKWKMWPDDATEYRIAVMSELGL